jgi:YfiH family protein
MRQVHGSEIIRVHSAGPAGEGDALITSYPELPLAVRTADCVPLVVHSDAAVAVVHAGWRGLAAGVVERTVEALSADGDRPRRAAIGPAIGPCCYEVGSEVVAALGGRSATTSWGTPSVDLWAETERRLAGVTVWRADLCTRCEVSFHSYRDTATDLRQTTVAWR